MSIRYENGMVEIISASSPITPAASLVPEHLSDDFINQPPGEIPAIPILGQPSLLQIALNRLPAVPVGRNNLKIQFGGNMWIATNNGRNFLAGTFMFEVTNEGYTITLKSTHIYPPRDIPRINWIKTSGPEIVLEYIVGPPASLKLISLSQDDSGRQRGGRGRENRENPEQETAIIEQREKEKQENAHFYLNTIGASIGTSFTAPLFICTLHGTIAPFKRSFFDIGIDMGWFSDMNSIDHFSLYPFTRFNYYIPFFDYRGGPFYDYRSGMFIGAGGGYGYTSYTVSKINKLSSSFFCFDFSTGLYLKGFTFSYSVRTNFNNANSKLSVGYLHRF